jgi:putative ABC transport system permease protein
MLHHSLLTALRHLRRHKLTTALNVVCLTIGLVCFLAICTMVIYLSSGDRHFANADRIYIVNQRINKSLPAPYASWLTADHLQTDFPELAVARATLDSGIASEVPITTAGNKTFVQVAYADPEFLDVFALPFLAGDARNALRVPRSAVIADGQAVRAALVRPGDVLHYE